MNPSAIAIGSREAIENFLPNITKGVKEQSLLSAEFEMPSERFCMNFFWYTFH